MYKISLDLQGVALFNSVCYRINLMQQPRTLADVSSEMPSPEWVDKHGLIHTTRIVRVSRAGVPFWQLTRHTVDGLQEVVEMRFSTPDVCDSASGAVWALRGIIAGWMRDDVRCTKGG